MSSIWYEYLEETGGEIIPSIYFKHVCRSFEKISSEKFLNLSNKEIKLAYNYKNEFWWPIIITDELSEGWVKFKYQGIDLFDDCLWVDLRNRNNSIKSIKWCIEEKKCFQSPNNDSQICIESILKENPNIIDTNLEYSQKNNYIFQVIKIGAYLECWLENSVGFVWPVKVLSNIGGRLKLIWFGCDLSSKQSSIGINNTFSMFYLDYRLHSLGWARNNGWKYSPPLNIGINISISNVDTFVRGSPTAFVMTHGCDRTIKEHFFEEGWQIEAVNPVDPSKIHTATIRYVMDKTYFLVELDNCGGDSIMFAGFGGMADILPANTSGISGYSLVGLKEQSWLSHLMEVNPKKYAPHLGYFHNGGGIDCHQDSAFLPGCKLEAVNPWNKQTIHAATIVRSMEGSRLVWVRLDSECDLPDFLVDPTTSTDIYPVGWCEMVGHSLIMPSNYGLSSSLCRHLCTPQDPPNDISRHSLTSLEPIFDHDDITIYLHPTCYLGPYLSRSVATDILPRFIGPGHSVAVLRQLFHLLLKVSHKPYKLMRLLQLDNNDDRHELMATVVVPSPKSEWGNRNKRSNWMVQVAVRKRAIVAFCRQTALSIGACPSFISISCLHNCHLGCEARMAARAGEKMSYQRRKRLFFRPLTSVGISYRELKSNIVGGTSNSSSNSEMDYSSDRDEQMNDQTIKAVESRMCTRGMRLVVSESRRRSSKRRITTTNNVKFVKTLKFEETIKREEEEEQLVPIADIIRRESRGRDNVTQSMIDIRHFVIDPTFLAGDIERVNSLSNPLTWTVEQLSDYLSNTDCQQLTTWLANERVDGRAFLLLTLPVLSTLCGLQLEVAIKLCRHIVSLKRLFVEQYADMKQLLPDDI